ncbi:hypothetical protein TWF730_004421 [Orbilia blumenaviensis]|uniref:Uncharacterized protein n=1 Tax=Orbilia blumenaviensis TaxID=1796055 RepID=A0AAV9TYF5_9PEZI
MTDHGNFLQWSISAGRDKLFSFLSVYFLISLGLRSDESWDDNAIRYPKLKLRYIWYVIKSVLISTYVYTQVQSPNLACALFIENPKAQKKCKTPASNQQQQEQLKDPASWLG